MQARARQPRPNNVRCGWKREKSTIEHGRTESDIALRQLVARCSLLCAPGRKDKRKETAEASAIIYAYRRNRKKTPPSTRKRLGKILFGARKWRSRGVTYAPQQDGERCSAAHRLLLTRELRCRISSAFPEPLLPNLCLRLWRLKDDKRLIRISSHTTRTRMSRPCGSINGRQILHTWAP